MSVPGGHRRKTLIGGGANPERVQQGEKNLGGGGEGGKLEKYGFQ